MTYAAAVAADRAGDIVRAAGLYEGVLEAEGPSLPVMLNLALLYWQATDPGLAAALHLDGAFFQRAGRRMVELLGELEQRFPDSAAARFWKLYIGWTALGGSITIEECRQLLRADPEEVLPALFLFHATGGEEGRSEAQELLRRARADGTTGARYVVSVLESNAAPRLLDEED